MFYRHSHTRRTSTPSATARSPSKPFGVCFAVYVTLHNPCNDRTVYAPSTKTSRTASRPKWLYIIIIMFYTFFACTRRVYYIIFRHNRLYIPTHTRYKPHTHTHIHIIHHAQMGFIIIIYRSIKQILFCRFKTVFIRRFTWVVRKTHTVLTLHTTQSHSLLVNNNR